MSSYSRVGHGAAVWRAKPWVVPAAILRSIVVIVLLIVFIWIELVLGVAYLGFFGLQVFVWTIIVFLIIWLFSLTDLMVLWVSHSYVLRQEGLEIRRGVIRLHSFAVTPSGFGDLSVYQGVGGRIFGFGDLTVLSQGERKTKLSLVRSPFRAADIIRDVMSKPTVRIERHV